MHEFDNSSILEAKADAKKQIIKGIKGKFNLKHTKEIVWIYEDEYDGS